MLIKYLIAAILVLTSLLTVGGFLLKQSYAKVGAQKEQIKTMAADLDAARKAEKRTRTISTARAAKVQQIEAEASRLRGALNSALTNNRVWADTPVPKEVVDALQ